MVSYSVGYPVGYIKEGVYQLVMGEADSRLVYKVLGFIFGECFGGWFLWGFFGGWIYTEICIKDGKWVLKGWFLKGDQIG